eukprot:505784-Rhodomonas_salina.2
MGNLLARTAEFEYNGKKATVALPQNNDSLNAGYRCISLWRDDTPDMFAPRHAKHKTWNSGHNARLIG